MWEVARQQRTSHFGMLEDFVSLVTDAIPELLTGQQKSLLLLALRAKMTQEVLSGDVPVDPDGVRHHMERIHTVSMETSSSVLKQWASSLQALCHTVQERPEARQHLLQNLLDQDFTAAFEGLLCHFLSRLNQSFPVPDFKQAAVWLSAPPTGMEECLQEIDSNREELKNLLSNQSYRLGHTTCPGRSVAEETLGCSVAKETLGCPVAEETLVGSVAEETLGLSVAEEHLLSTWSRLQLPPHTPASKLLVQSEPAAQQNSTQEEEDNCDAAGSGKESDTVIGQSQASIKQPIIALNRCDRRGSQSEPACPPQNETESSVRGLQDSLQALTEQDRSCFQCASSFQTDSELKAHSQAHQCPYQCSHCDKRFRLLSTLTTHQQTHRAAGGFTCGRCVSVFNSANLTQLRIHLREHKQRSFQCDQCPKSFITLQSLQVHGRRHSGPQAHLCSQCGKRFWTRGGLENHLRLHNGEKPFCCQDCGKTFTALAGLVVHVRLHTGERPYVCTVCGKGWPSKGDLQKHMRVHTGERPYVCQDCGKAFAISCHLNEHRRSHTAGQQCRMHNKRSKAMMRDTIAIAVPGPSAPQTAAELLPAPRTLLQQPEQPDQPLQHRLPADASGLAVTIRGPLAPELFDIIASSSTSAGAEASVTPSTATAAAAAPPLSRTTAWRHKIQEEKERCARELGDFLKPAKKLLPLSWRQTLPEKQQEWVGRALFRREPSSGKVVLTTPPRLWWLSCDRALIGQLKERTLGNGVSRLRASLVEQHSRDWMARSIEYLSVLRKLTGPGAAQKDVSLPAFVKVLYVDRDCCAAVGKSSVHEMQEWRELVVRLDVWHLMRRFARGVTTDSHLLYGLFMARLSFAIFEWDGEDVARLKEAKQSSEGRDTLSAKELARHCRRRTRGAAETARLLQEVLDA
ncbi:unnamed protein product [Merluccius merluccius]